MPLTFKEKSQNNLNRLQFLILLLQEMVYSHNSNTGNRFLLTMNSSTWYQPPLPLLTLDKKILPNTPFESFHLSLQVWISCYLRITQACWFEVFLILIVHIVLLFVLLFCLFAPDSSLLPLSRCLLLPPPPLPPSPPPFLPPSLLRKTRTSMSASTTSSVRTTLRAFPT